jgi:hypothetical protein
MTDAFCKVVILEHAGRLQILMIDRVVGADLGQCGLVVEVLAAGASPSGAPWQAA